MQGSLRPWRIRIVLLLMACASISLHAQTPSTDDDRPAGVVVSDPALDDAIATVEAPPVEEKSRDDLCRSEESDDKLIDHIHGELYKLTCSSASWFDGLFGHRRYEQDYRKSNGIVTTGALWSQREGFDKLLRFKVHFYLPQANERFHAFIGRSNRDEFVTEARQELYALPNQFNRGPDDDVFLGLGYAEPMQKHGSFDADAGVRLQFPLDPYVRGSYRFARPIGETNLLRFRESLFWENIEGLGTTTLVDWDHIVAENKMVRWTNSGTYSQNSIGLRWYSTLTLFHSLDHDRAFAYEVAGNGQTDLRIPVEDFGAAIIYRQRVWRDYLVIELRTGVDWPRQFLEDHRQANLNAALAFELRYGGP
jgi:hypothetical protein